MQKIQVFWIMEGMFTTTVLKGAPENAKVTLDWGERTRFSIFIDATNEVSHIYVNMGTGNDEFVNFFLNFFNNLAFSTIFDPRK